MLSFYQVIAYIVGFIVFLAAWGISISTYGVWGWLLGWFPAQILGFIAGIGWPIMVVFGLAAWVSML